MQTKRHVLLRKDKHFLRFGYWQTFLYGARQEIPQALQVRLSWLQLLNPAPAAQKQPQTNDRGRAPIKLYL